MYSPNRSIRTISLISLALGCFGLSPQAGAVCQEGCLTNSNTALGEDALLNNTTGVDNTAIGFHALYSNTAGIFNTAIGSQALYSNTTGYVNTATGHLALFSNTTGSNNTANGEYALFSNTIGLENTATGDSALANNTTGYNNTANGRGALLYNTTGDANTATGGYALVLNTTGSYNTANGQSTLLRNTIGNYNTANGYSALYFNTTGGNNTANGSYALFFNTEGDSNTATGDSALYSNTKGINNTGNGYQALLNNRRGNNNIGLGVLAGSNLSDGDNNIDIGNAGVADEAGIIRIGTAGIQTATFVAGIRETPLAQGVAVAVGITADGQLGVRASSARFKEAIKPMEKASEAIFSLQPVTFRYKKAVDPQALPQFGLVAEQVAKVNPNLVARDAEGKPFTVRYEEVNAMLLNEFLKEHRKVEELEATVAVQQKCFESQIAALTAAFKAQATQIQKVSDQLRTQAPAPRVVAND